MTFTKSLFAAAALSSLAFAFHSTPSLADGARNFKPTQAITFSVGSKQAVGYFTTERDTCKLVLTLAERPTDTDDSFTSIRHEEAVAAGHSSRFSNEGKSFVFGCSDHADNMTFSPVSSVASSE